MNTIVLLINRDSTWSPEGWAEAAGGKRISTRQIMIERDGEWMSIIRNDDALSDFDDAERARLDDLVRNPGAYLIEWGGADLVENLLRSIPPSISAAVDNDHGLLVSVRRVAAEPLESWVRAAALS